MGTTLGAGVVPHKGVAHVTGRQIFALPAEMTATHADETHNDARGSAGIAMRRPAAQTSAPSSDASDLLRLEGSGDIFRLV